MNINLFSIAAYLYEKLQKGGICFNQKGYPIIPPEMLITKVPEEIIPFEHRNDCINPKTTVLCHFGNDELLYRRLKKLDEDIDECRNYMGVTGFDLSPRRGYDVHYQEFNQVLNQMVNAYRALHGIHILPNFRTGDISTIDSLSSNPPNSIYVAGTLGCARGYVLQNKILLKTKILYARPRELLIYGTLQNEYSAIMDEYGQPYRVYDDYQRNSRRKAKEIA